MLNEAAFKLKVDKKTKSESAYYAEKAAKGIIQEKQ
jgi:hypothetical protein